MPRLVLLLNYNPEKEATTATHCIITLSIRAPFNTLSFKWFYRIVSLCSCICLTQKTGTDGVIAVTTMYFAHALRPLLLQEMRPSSLTNKMIHDVRSSNEVKGTIEETQAAIKRSSFSWNMTIVLLCRYPRCWSNPCFLCASVPGAELTSSLPLLSVVLKQFTQIPLSAPLLFDLCSALSIILLKSHKSERYSWTIYFFGGGIHPRSESSITLFLFFCLWSYSSLRL